MPEGTEGGVQVDATPDSNTDSTTKRAPWEAAGQEFDPERAWTLIQNLTGERDTIKAERAALAQAQQEVTGTIATLLGVPADQAVSKLPEVLGGLQSALAIERLARAHKITNDDDIAALSAVSDAQAREKLAARLASLSTPTPAGDDTYPRPKPDATQGTQNDPIPLNGTGIENAVKSALGIA